MSPKAASLSLVGAPPAGERVSIHHDSATGEFVLREGEREIARSEHPKPLERYAWANGANEIRHAYDLKLAE